MGPGTPWTHRAHDAARQAEVIEKLQFVAIQLDKVGRFDETRRRIDETARAVVQALLHEFETADGDEAAMTACARTLYRFYPDAHAQCAEQYMEHQLLLQCGEGSPGDPAQFAEDTRENDFFEEMETVAERFAKRSAAIFSGPERLQSKLAPRLFRLPIRNFVIQQLSIEAGFLARLQRLYRLCSNLAVRLLTRFPAPGVSPPGSIAAPAVVKMLRGADGVFEDYLGPAYINTELGSLALLHSQAIAAAGEEDDRVLARFIPEHVGEEGRRASLRRGSIPPALTLKWATSVTGALPDDAAFICQDAALAMLHENKQAVERCVELLGPTHRPDAAASCFRVLLENLCVNYVQRLLEQLALKAKRSASIRPNGALLRAVRLLPAFPLGQPQRELIPCARSVRRIRLCIWCRSTFGTTFCPRCASRPPPAKPPWPSRTPSFRGRCAARPSPQPWPR